MIIEGNDSKQLPLDSITKQTFKGGLFLLTRQLLVQGFNIIGGILLARILSPSEYGYYAIITFILSFLISFGDVGLGASLIRQTKEPKKEDYQAVFTAQQLLILVVIVIFWGITPFIIYKYKIQTDELWSIRFLVLTLFFTSLQSMASIKLERNLCFNKLAVVEICQSAIFNSSLVGLAFIGLGIKGFVIALLVRSIIGALLANIFSPWEIGLRIDWDKIKSHLSFGIPYQGINFISLVKDSITPIFIGYFLGATEVGYINWATMTAAYAVLALMVFQRLYLPAFSRMKDHPEDLSLFVEKIIAATNMVVAPLSVLLLVYIIPITKIIFGEKWLAALPLFYLLWLANLFVATATPVMGLLNALGFSRITFLFALVWMLGTWIFGIPLIYLWGSIGYAWANLLVQFTNIFLFRIAQKKVRFKIIKVVYPFWAFSFFVGCIMYFVQYQWPVKNIIILFLNLMVGLVIYSLLIMFIKYPLQLNNLIDIILRRK